jgi:hypothetical protein
VTATFSAPEATVSEEAIRLQLVFAERDDSRTGHQRKRPALDEPLARACNQRDLAVEARHEEGHLVFGTSTFIPDR